MSWIREGELSLLERFCASVIKVCTNSMLSSVTEMQCLSRNIRSECLIFKNNLL